MPHNGRFAYTTKVSRIEKLGSKLDRIVVTSSKFAAGAPEPLERLGGIALPALLNLKRSSPSQSPPWVDKLGTPTISRLPFAAADFNYAKYQKEND